jgi:PAS domain S-box-containing protein
MNSEEWSQLLQILRDRRDAVADNWYQVIASTGFVPLSQAEIRQHLAEWAGQLIELLFAEPLDRDQARAIGAALARLHYVRPDVAGRTQEVLALFLVEGLSAEQLAALQPRLTVLLGELTTGFTEQVCETILAEQEQIRKSLVATLKETEASLRESEARYRAVSELISACAYCYRVEPDGTFVIEWITREFEQVTGFSYDEIREHGGWQRLVCPDDMPAARKHLQAQLSGEPDVSELRIVAADGNVRWVRNYGRPVWDEGRSRVVGIVGAMQDITENKRLQQSVIHAERLAATGRLAAALAHEINNPLQALRSGLGVLVHHSFEDEKRQHYLEVVNSEVERLVAIAERALDFYHTSVEQKELVDIHAILDEVLVLVREKLRSRQVAVRGNLSADLPYLAVVPTQMIQVFLNIVFNALDAMPDGGELTLETGWDRNRQEAWVSFTDTGQGIPDSEIPLVFEPFHTTKPTGMGMGLTFSDRVVRQHGGHIEVESQVDVGSTFTVFLPLTEADTEAHVELREV